MYSSQSLNIKLFLLFYYYLFISSNITSPDSMSYIAEIIFNLSSFYNLVKTSLAFKHSTLCLAFNTSHFL